MYTLAVRKTKVPFPFPRAAPRIIKQRTFSLLAIYFEFAVHHTEMLLRQKMKSSMASYLLLLVVIVSVKRTKM